VLLVARPQSFVKFKMTLTDIPTCVVQP